MARRPSLHVAEQVFNLLASLVGQVFNLPALHQSSLPALLTLGLLGCPALAQTNLPPHPIPESQRWATITHPGNAPYIYQYHSFESPFEFGRVDYEYQISRTEVTAGEWVEFVNAYARYLEPGPALDSRFTGTEIGPNEFGVFTVTPGSSNRPVEISWRYAARYVNWLHNNKQPQREAFENGAYDTSTFGHDANLVFTDQQSRSPGSRYWIPTEDEWVKAAYWDPNKNGPDQPGYWTYATSSDIPPTIGSPSMAQTSGGSGGFRGLPEVAAYRDVVSPWGLWDTSGGQSEWTETIRLDPITNPEPIARVLRGTDWFDFFPPDGLEERLEWAGGSSHPIGLNGLRIARAIPAPASVLAAVIGFMSITTCRARRR